MIKITVNIAVGNVTTGLYQRADCFYPILGT